MKLNSEKMKLNGEKMKLNCEKIKLKCEPPGPSYIGIRPSPVFFRLASNAFSDIGSVGQSD